MRAETFQQGANLNGSNDYATIVKNGNIGKRDAAGIAVSAQIPVQKWWNANVVHQLQLHQIFRYHQ